MNQPDYFSYFTQGESPYFDLSWIEKEDLSWIDDLNQARELSKQQEIENNIEDGGDPAPFHFSFKEEPASKDFESVYFPGYHEWPDSFRSKYDSSVKNSADKIAEIIKTADEKLTFDELTIYVECDDGNHYISTKYYDYGSVTIAVIDEDSDFDSVDTAVYAFINDYRDWESEHGDAYRKARLLSELEALRDPQPFDDFNLDCDHGDLGSLGYKHGEVVKCPHCGKPAEVW